MNLREFLREERELKKQRRLAEKASKKGTLTKEQKAYKVFGIIFGFLVLFGAIFYTCKSMSGSGDSGFSWNDIVGISDEVIAELEKPVVEEEILSSGKIEESDWIACMDTMKSNGLDFFTNGELDEEKMTKDYTLSSDMTLTPRQAGALFNNLLNFSVPSVTLLELSLKYVDEVYIEESVVLVDLEKLLSIDNLPSIYLRTRSEAIILDNSIGVFNSEVFVNNCSEEVNEEIIEVLNSNSSISLYDIGNKLVNTSIKSFVSSLDCKINLTNNGFLFKSN